MTDYITDDDLRTFIKDNSSLDAGSIAAAITTASRTVDQMCRRPANGFSPADTATVKYFDAECSTECELESEGVHHEFWTTSGLVVQTDTNGDGTYETTLTADTHFYLEPLNSARYGVSGWPYDELCALATSGTTFPRSLPGYRPPIKITAKWGWAAVPDQVTFAVKLAANRLFGRGDARYGTAGFDAAGFAMRIRSDPDIQALLEPFIPASMTIA